MSIVGSISQLILQAKDGDELALAKLHSRYWPRLVELSRRRLNGSPISSVDDEDVAQEAFIGFYRSLKAERIPDLKNRHHLLAFLSHIVACKAVNQFKISTTLKRGGGKVQSGSPFMHLVKDEAYTPLENVILEDCYRFYFSSLSESLQPFAELHLAGFTNLEIAERMGCAGRTVDRKLSLLREEWLKNAIETIDKDINSLLK